MSEAFIQTTCVQGISIKTLQPKTWLHFYLFDTDFNSMIILQLHYYAEKKTEKWNEILREKNKWVAVVSLNQTYNSISSQWRTKTEVKLILPSNKVFKKQPRIPRSEEESAWAINGSSFLPICAFTIANTNLYNHPRCYKGSK